MEFTSWKAKWSLALLGQLLVTLPTARATPITENTQSHFDYNSQHRGRNINNQDSWPVAAPVDHQVPLLLGAPRTSARVNKGDLGRLPALGWNSWNAYRCDIDEAKVLSAADSIVSLGLQDVGYEYVNIDDCWSIKDHRDATTGRILPDLSKFPDGINGTAEKIHDLGLKIGIYSSAGMQTCAGYPASLENELLDATTFSEWGIDYLKYDNCGVPPNWLDECSYCQELNHTENVCVSNSQTSFCPPNYDYSKSKSAERYNRMRDAIDAQPRPILYSLCQWGEADVQSWGNSTAQSWRSTGDIAKEWPSVVDLLNRNSFTGDSTDFWGHSDADMLEIGNGWMSVPEERTHFAMWAAMKSPLLIGCDLSQAANTSIRILKNEFLLKFNQDGTFGAPARPYKWGTNPDWTFNSSYPAEYWSGQSELGTFVFVFNVEDSTVVKNVAWSEIPGLDSSESYRVISAWDGHDYGCIQHGVNFRLQGHDTGVAVLKGGCYGKKMAKRAATITLDW